MTVSVVYIGQYRRLEEAAVLRGPLAAGHDLGALLDAIGDMRLDLFDRLHVDQWPNDRAPLEPVGDLHRAGGLGEAVREGVIDAALHQDTVGAYAGLAGIAKFQPIGPLAAISMFSSVHCENQHGNHLRLAKGRFTR
jgi:hypothetical protein